MTTRDELSIKFWFRAGNDVVTTLERPGGPRIITEFYLDGVGWEDQEVLLGFVLVRLELTGPGRGRKHRPTGSVPSSASIEPGS